MAEEHSLPYYLPIVGGRIIGFIPFLRVSVLREMQSVSSRIWTRVTVSISYDDNHYTTGTSVIIIIIIIIIYSLEFFTSALADGVSLESEWQQVYSSLQDSSQYSGRSQ